MSNFEYVNSAYGVNACAGRIVEFRGRTGIISEDRGNYIGITFDDEKPGTVSNFHPKTDGLVYLGIGKIRRMTASQNRYKRYKELRDIYDFENFAHFLKWDTLRRRSVRRWGES